MFGWESKATLRRHREELRWDYMAHTREITRLEEQVAFLSEDHKGPSNMWDWISPHRLHSTTSYK